jgi:hypothetical protein
MTAPKNPGDARLTPDSEVDFTGYDPYIVALTGGGPADAGSIAGRTAEHSRESRKAVLMDWLRKQGA